MRTPALPSPRRIAAGVGLALLAAGLVPIAASPANAASSGLIITEFYGNGGNSGANLNVDYVELFNPTPGAISLAGKSIQYRSTAGTGAGTAVALSGSVPAGKHYLIQVQAAGANGSAIPTPDLATANLNAGGIERTGLPAQTRRPRSPFPPVRRRAINNSQVIDLLGFGTSTLLSRSRDRYWHRNDIVPTYQRER